MRLHTSVIFSKVIEAIKDVLNEQSADEIWRNSRQVEVKDKELKLEWRTSTLPKQRRTP